MNCTIKQKEVTVFQPVTVTIEVTSAAELAALWHRFNAAPEKVIPEDADPRVMEADEPFPIWNAVDDLMIELEIDPTVG